MTSLAALAASVNISLYKYTRANRPKAAPFDKRPYSPPAILSCVGNAVAASFKSFIIKETILSLDVLGTLAFVVPGIILGLGLSMTPYLLANYPSLSIFEAITTSWKMMQGKKMKCFVLFLVFMAGFY